MHNSTIPSKKSGTPSKGKKGQSRSVDPAAATGNSVWKTLRWILFGFGVGAATTAMFHSVNMPSIRVELEYADAPALHHIQRRNEFKFQNEKVGAKNDDDVDQEEEDDDDDTVQKEREEIQLKLKEADHPNDSEFLEAAARNSTSTSKDESETEGEYKASADEPDFSSPGPPPKLAPGEAFAACILIKDDNHWLIEWLAYHYHVMPLRYLIVAVDPDSKTSPIPILKRYRDRKLMTVSIWNDKMFMPKKINANPKMFDNNTELMYHRVRQNNFYFKCMRTFKQRNREWLMLIDTDEYIVTNYASGLYYNITKNIPITKPGNVLTFIKQHHDLSGENHTCSYMPRYMFGVKESPAEIVQRNMGLIGMNGKDFLTQRFMYRNPRRMHNGKNLINIMKLPQIKTYTSVHHVSSYCPNPDEMRTVNHVKKALVRVHHYLGTEDQYFFRSDPRQPKPKNTTKPPDPNDALPIIAATNTTSTTAKKKGVNAYFTRGKGRYQMLNRRSNYPDQGARAWVRGFIADVGVETAKALLAGVGQVGYEGEKEELNG